MLPNIENRAPIRRHKRTALGSEGEPIEFSLSIFHAVQQKFSVRICQGQSQEDQDSLTGLSSLSGPSSTGS
jgi:hypothetical protein